MYKMIIVDDEPPIRSGLRQMIEREVYGIDTIVEAEDGLAAYRTIKELSPDIALIDINMPQMNGIELIELCSHLESTPKFIILSSYNDFEYVRSAMCHGAVNYLLKPVDQEELCSTIKSTVRLLDELRCCGYRGQHNPDFQRQCQKTGPAGLRRTTHHLQPSPERTPVCACYHSPE